MFASVTPDIITLTVPNLWLPSPLVRLFEKVRPGLLGQAPGPSMPRPKLARGQMGQGPKVPRT